MIKRDDVNLSILSAFEYDSKTVLCVGDGGRGFIKQFAR